MIGSFGPSSGNRDMDEMGADPASVDISALHCADCLRNRMFALFQSSNTFRTAIIVYCIRTVHFLACAAITATTRCYRLPPQCASTFTCASTEEPARLEKCLHKISISPLRSGHTIHTTRD